MATVKRTCELSMYDTTETCDEGATMGIWVFSIHHPDGFGWHLIDHVCGQHAHHVRRLKRDGYLAFGLPVPSMEVRYLIGG